MKLIFTLLLFSRIAFAEQKLISFEGFVQFSEGPHFVVSQSGVSTPAQYGTPIYEDTQLRSEKNSTLKFVTRANCVVVVYGEGNMNGPQGEKPWRITSQAVRFLCPEKNEEKFIFHGVEVVPHGETLFESSGKIFVITGSLKVGQTLTSRRIYQYSKGAMNPVAQTPQAQYDFDNQYNPPRESEKLQKPKPLIPDKYRIEIGSMTGPAILLHANGYLNHYDYASNGPRVEFIFKNDIPGIILGLRYLETQSQNQNGSINNSASTQDHLRTFGIDAGYRFDFDRWWSPFVRAGVMWTRNELLINSPAAIGCTSNCGGYNSDQILDYFGVSANIGIDALLRPSWLGGVGIFASAEIELDQTIQPTTTSVVNVQSSRVVPNEATNEHGFITDFNGLIHFGLLYQF